MKNSFENASPLDQLRSRLNLYSFLLQIIFVFLDLLVSGVSLIIANEAKQSLTLLYMSLGCGVLSLVLLCVLAALYFAGSPEEILSLSRMKACLRLRMSLRFLGMLNAVFLLIYEYAGDRTRGSWDDFLRVYSVLALVVSFLVLLYALWKISWINANPERYADSYYIKMGRQHPVAKKPASKEKAPSSKGEVVEVKSVDKTKR
jgi:hypothetical protein